MPDLTPPCSCSTTLHAGTLKCTDDGHGPQQLRLPDGTLLDEGDTFELHCVRDGASPGPWTGTYVVPEASGVAMLVAGCLLLAVLGRRGR